MKFINLACGPTYIANSKWTNVDFSSSGNNVIGCDLLKPLPFKDNTFDVVYSSHFLEHIPRNAVKGFLLECKRILKPGGFIRLVLPDCEEMFSAFLDLRARGMHEEANFVIIEIVDQCVRHQSGGELGTFYGKMRQMDFRERSHWQLFVASRNGEGLDPMGNLGGEENRNSNFQDFCTYIRKAPFMAYIRLRRKLHNLGIKLLLPAFRRQNVSFTAVGEKHCWLWDLHQLRNELVDAGFSSVTRQSHRSSSIEDFPLVPLDSTNDGRPRKGLESMYVEARI